MTSENISRQTLQKSNGIGMAGFVLSIAALTSYLLAFVLGFYMDERYEPPPDGSDLGFHGFTFESYLLLGWLIACWTKPNYSRPMRS